jgi:hypothetical protein
MLPFTDRNLFDNLHDCMCLAETLLVISISIDYVRNVFCLESAREVLYLSLWYGVNLIHLDFPISHKLGVRFSSTDNSSSSEPRRCVLLLIIERFK